MMIERTAKYSEFALQDGYSREDIIEKIGEPIESEDIILRIGEPIESEGAQYMKCDVYLVEGRVFDSGDHWASAAGWGMTLGIHELFFFPMSVWEVISEGISPTEKKLEICGGEGHWQLYELDS